jgi:hypothetical protein
MGEPLRHRQTKEAATDTFKPTATGPHLDSTHTGGGSAAHRGRAEKAGVACNRGKRVISTVPARCDVSTSRIHEDLDQWLGHHALSRLIDPLLCSTSDIRYKTCGRVLACLRPAAKKTPTSRSLRYHQLALSSVGRRKH